MTAKNPGFNAMAEACRYIINGRKIFWADI